MNTRADVARALAWLISEPDDALVEALNSGEMHRMVSLYPCSVPVDREFLKDGQQTVQGLSKKYRHCFTLPGSGLSLAESVYKPWCDDSEAPPDYTETGLLMGDPAVHMMELYRHAQITVPACFNGSPDHLSLELEFLAALIEADADNPATLFIRDHLDWVPELVRRSGEVNMDPFYMKVILLIDVFIHEETGRLSALCEVNS